MNKKSAFGICVLITICILGTFCTNGFAEPNATASEGEITISTSEKIGEINPDIYGLFAADYYHVFNGGMWAEMLRSRKFAEDDREDDENGYGVVKYWFAIGRNEKTHFAHDSTVFYCGARSQKILNENGPEHKIGIGQKGLCLDSTKNYLVRLNLKQKDIKGPVIIALEGEKTVYDQKEITVPDGDWSRHSFTLKPSQSDKDGRFTITFTGPGTLWVGTASLMPDDNVSGFRKDVIEAFKAIHPSNIRGLGGNNISCYRWQDGIGDPDKRPPRFDKAFSDDDQWISNDAGTDEFIEFCRLIGAKPTIVVNAGDGTAAEAADYVQYCNGSTNTKYGKMRADNGHPEPYNVKIWGIGNEMFGNWQFGHVDEETYAKRHLEFAKAMLAVDKNIKLVASGGRYWKFPRWNQALFKTAGNYLDYLSLHSYAKKYRAKLKKEQLKDPKLAEEIYYYIVSSPYGIEEQLIETDKEIRKILPERLDIKISFDEWNAYYYKAPYEEIDFALRDSIYTAGVLHAFQRQSNAVTLANFSGIANSIGMIRINNCGLFLNPQYLAFKMYTNHSGPTLLKTSVKCDTFAAPDYEEGRPQAKSKIPYLDVSATTDKDGKILYLAVINLHADKNVKTKVSFDKWNFEPQVKTFELYNDDYMAENTFDNPEKITIKENILNGTGNPFDYSFKPHSITIMELRQK
jgi:alpha-N-arabinofuranosidase